MSQPPPIPPHLPYARPQQYSSSGPSKPSFIAQAAKASWIAPLVVAGLNMCSGPGMYAAESGKKVIAYAAVALLVLGIIFTFVALYGVFIKREKGILGYTIAGVLVNGLIVFGLISLVFAARNRPGGVGGLNSSQRQAQLAQAEQQGRDAFANYPGWLGVLRLNGGLCVMTQTGDDAAIVTDLRNEFATPFSVLVLAYDNTAGTADVTLDTTSVVLQFADGKAVKQVPSRQVFMTARKDRDRWLATERPSITVAKGDKLSGYQIFIPERIDLTNLDHLTMTIDGQPMAVPGRVYSVEEKKELQERGKSGR